MLALLTKNDFSNSKIKKNNNVLDSEVGLRDNNCNAVSHAAW
jgi:hypothetical protein